MSASTPSARSAVWAESGQTTAPSTGEQQSGYTAGKPSRRKTNWLLNWLDNAVQYMLAQGYQTAADVASALGSLHSTITGETTSAISTALGTASGALADGTVTPTGSSVTVAYANKFRFPGSTRALVTFRISFPVGGGTPGGINSEVTLSGAAAFAAGADSVVVTAGEQGYGGDGAPGGLRAYVSDSQKVRVQASGLDLTVTNSVNVTIYGH